MCGRYAITLPPEAMRGLFDLAEAPEPLTPRWNVAPSQPIPTLIERDGARRLVMLRWGLHPYWLKEPPGAKSMINARAEGAFDKPFFREALARRRALIPADGFYEWRREGKTKQPFYIRRADGAPMAFAGMWERWGPRDAPTLTAAFLTRAANEFMQPLHDRMPVIVPERAFAAWLAPDAAREALEAIVADAGEVALEAWPVSRAVNAPANEGPELIRPV